MTDNPLTITKPCGCVIRRSMIDPKQALEFPCEFHSDKNKAFTEKLNELFGSFQPSGRMARWRAFVLGPNWFCWNTEPFSIEMPKPWACWIYRHNKGKGTFKKVGKTLYFAKRNVAKRRAKQWYDRAKARKDRGQEPKIQRQGV